MSPLPETRRARLLAAVFGGPGGGNVAGKDFSVAVGFFGISDTDIASFSDPRLRPFLPGIGPRGGLCLVAWRWRISACVAVAIGFGLALARLLVGALDPLRDAAELIEGLARNSTLQLKA